MATASTASTASYDLSIPERQAIVAALTLKAASVQRAERAEANPEVKRMREVEYSQLMNLVSKFR